MADNKFVRIGTRGLKIAKLNDDGLVVGEPLRDRKSTRLNSSHLA